MNKTNREHHASAMAPCMYEEWRDPLKHEPWEVLGLEEIRRWESAAEAAFSHIEKFCGDLSYELDYD